MNQSLKFLIFIVVALSLMYCKGEQPNQAFSSMQEKENQTKIVGGGCDGCELMYEGMPTSISSIDTSAGWFEPGQKLLVTGKIFKLDGKTPAPNIILYYWQTDTNGYYSFKQGMNEKAKRHGHIRGWVKTDNEGKFSIYTNRPSPYPNKDLPAHIHFSVKEPDLQDEYYTEEINFDDDKLLIPYLKKYPQENRGGSGIVRVLVKGDLQIAEHDIVLGLNIPNYPKILDNTIHSGLSIGEDQPSFTPFHAFGPDKGKQTCPVCKYGRYHGILFYVGNKPNWNDVKKWLVFLEQESTTRQKYLKAYFIYGNDDSYSKEKLVIELEQLGKELKLRNVALTFVPSFTDRKSEVHLNKINPEVENTFIIYKHRSIIDKYIDLKPTAENFKLLSETLNKTKGEYFDLSEPDNH